MYPSTSPMTTAPMITARFRSSEPFPDDGGGVDMYISGVGAVAEAFVATMIEPFWAVVIVEGPAVGVPVEPGAGSLVGAAVGVAVGVGVAGASTPRYTFATSVPSCLTEYTAEGRPDVLMLAVNVPSPPTLWSW